MTQINFKAIEKKWQDKWEKKKAFEVSEKNKKNKFYVLEQFAYPSGSGLHIGHAFVYTIGDIFARFKRMNGFNVLHPVGYDSLGLPAENAAIKAKIHPKTYTNNAIKYFSKQQKAMGLSYDWNRMFATHNPDYYKWDQWIFLKMFEKGLVYQKQSPVNYCRECDTVLANEQVHNGKCWRHETIPVEIKHLKQWYFKITDYAEELNDFSKLDQWPELIKKLQKNWIGKSFGTEIEFEINGKKWPIFTTRPDTIYGVTFMVVSAQHPRLTELVTREQKKEVERFVKKLSSVSEEEIDQLEKEGVFTGSYATNPINNEKVPVYAGNFVLADYGCGMVMAVPAHDKRDFEFAKKYNIPIQQVIAPVFENTFDKDAVRNDKKTEERDSVFIIVKHWKEDKYFCLDWKEHKWKSFLLGGIEKGETAEQAALREVKEETGYLDIKSIKQIGFEVHSKFYAEHKDVNRYGRYKMFIAELKSDKFKKPREEETKNHNGFWLEKNKIESFLNLKNHKYAWDIYLNGEKAYTEEGTLVNSGQFNGLNSKKAIEEISNYLENKKLGRKTINFRLKDWLISRQRYWGTPIPIIYCEKCGVVPVPEKNLPVKLPEKIKFGKGNPLGTAKNWIKVKCPKCKGNGKREIDTMDTFVNSSWYHLRFCDPKNNSKIFNSEKANYWNPIDVYIGGKEHACMHDIYIRFYHKFLRDLGLLKSDEPAKRLFVQGIVHGEDGNKMSKSLGNTLDPMEIINKYGADSLRLFLISNASPESDFNWSEKGIQGSFKFLNKVSENLNRLKIGKSSKRIESKINKTIKEITEDIENLRYNLGVIKLRKLFDDLEEEISKKDAESFLKILSVFCPHISEELWEKIGNKGCISLADWPVADEKKIDDKLEKAEQIVNNTISDILNILKIIEDKGKKGEKIYIYVMPFEKEFFDEKKISERVQKQVKIFAVNDKDKYDPKGIAKKSKPGRPGIFIE